MVINVYDLVLVEPSKEYERQAIEYRQEYIDCGEKHINGSCGFIHYSNYDEWLEKVKMAQNAKTSFVHVPATTYFSIRVKDNKIIGTIQLRHHLSEELRKHGGHIGYGIRPSERQKGYATQQLELVLNKAKELQIPKVMITCDKDNIASAKVTIKNGGVLKWEGNDEKEGTEIQIYWIDIL